MGPIPFLSDTGRVLGCLCDGTGIAGFRHTGRIWAELHWTGVDGTLLSETGGVVGEKNDRR